MTAEDIALRLSAALAVGFIFGLERERHGRAAGLRTLILVSLSAALAGMLPDEIIGDAAQHSLWRPDPMRLGAGLFAGIGFLGAGTIIRQGSLVRGVTTAALLWFATMSGLCFGFGEFGIGASGSVVAIGAVRLLPWLERRLVYDRYARLTVLTRDEALPAGALDKVLGAHSVHIRSVSVAAVNADRSWKRIVRVRYRQPASTSIAETVVTRLAALPGVTEVEWGDDD